MSTVKQLEDEINKELLNLSRDISHQRESDINPNTIQKTMDRFLINWSGRLNEEQDAQLMDSRTQAEEVHPHLGLGATILQEQDRAQLVIVDTAKTQAVVKDHINQLRDGMIKAVQAIEKGREPNLVLLVEQQIARAQEPDSGRETAPETWEQYSTRKQLDMPLQKVDPAHDISR